MRLGSRPYDPLPRSLRHFRRPPPVAAAQPPTTSSVVRPISGLQITFIEFRRRHVTTKDRCCAAQASFHRFLRSSPQRAGVLRSGRRPRRRNSFVLRFDVRSTARPERVATGGPRPPLGPSIIIAIYTGPRFCAAPAAGRPPPGPGWGAPHYHPLLGSHVISENVSRVPTPARL
jgi:hypothetical protein